MAVVKIKILKNGAYIQQIIYSKRITTGDAIEILKDLQISPRDNIYVDSQAASSIEEVKRAGYNIRKSNKDVFAGIMKVKSMALSITKDSQNIIK